MNHLSKLLSPAGISVACTARDKAGALDAAAALFAAVSGVPAAGIRASLAAREALGSTGLGQGVAIPHGRLRGIREAQAVVVQLAVPVEFGAPDGRPVGLLVALLVPEHATEEHLEVLSELAQMLSDKDMRAALFAETSAAALHARVSAWEPVRPAA
jgi:PTS system nitrogen regulatory IIA component